MGAQPAAKPAPAPHVQAAVARTVQPKPAAPEIRRPAPHVQAALSPAVQPKTAPPQAGSPPPRMQVLVQSPNLEMKAKQIVLLPQKAPPVSHQPREVQCVKRTLGTRGPLTRSALGGDASAATTWVEARINGWSVGRFNNLTTPMKKFKPALDNNKRHMLIPYDTDPAKRVLKKGQEVASPSPHAEDYLLGALLKFARSGKIWDDYYPRAGGQQYTRRKTYGVKNIEPNSNNEDVLTLYIDKTPCESCAQNLHNFCQQYGLRLRIKAGHKYEDPDPGSQYLKDQGIHVRRWGLDSMKRYMEKTGVDVAKRESLNSTRIPKRSEKEKNTFASGKIAEQSWRLHGWNRKA